MKNKGKNRNIPGPEAVSREKNNPDGYPLYPSGDDIYSKYQEEHDIDPENISGNKESNANGKPGRNNEKDFNDDVSGSDLDIPGVELDDQHENAGIEDEENNYYSLGGDDHNDLEEYKEE
jgi:hypothetical protein